MLGMQRHTATVWSDPAEPTLLLVQFQGNTFYAEQCEMNPPAADLAALTLDEVEDRHWPAPYAPPRPRLAAVVPLQPTERT